MLGNDEQHERELETTLVIRSDHPEGIARKLAELTEISNYDLLFGGIIQISDSYFDTPDCALDAQGLALRIRQSESTEGRPGTGGTRNSYITLKGPSKSNRSGGESRMEIENSWSRKALEKVINELRAR